MTKTSDAVEKRIKVVVCKPKTPGLEHAFIILEHGLASVNSLADLFTQVTSERGRGTTSHADQDLLRAMVVMAGSTLDAVTKRVIRDALPELAKMSPFRENAAKRLHRRILKSLGGNEGQVLADALLSDNPRDLLIDHMIEDLVDSSYQSVDKMKEIFEFLGISDHNVRSSVKCLLGNLAPAFEARNQIVHEMDATPGTKGPGKKKRRARKREDMYEYSARLLQVAATLLDGLDDAITSASRREEA